MCVCVSKKIKSGIVVINFLSVVKYCKSIIYKKIGPLSINHLFSLISYFNIKKSGLKSGRKTK